ncbi:hypothetical protein PH5382_01914 [Phaeobacter sp. CECT 5382]|nr:hypothetical protein PH5382_01914 [Phaeobacter sp. CECT 5382]
MSWGIAMSDKDEAMTELDDLFAVARHTPPRMSQDLTAAILSDAANVLDERAKTAAVSFVSAQQDQGVRRLWRQFTSAVGGWPALGGMVAASLSGLWIGLAPPSFLPDPVAQIAELSNGSQLISNLGYDVSLLIGEEVIE